MWGVGRGAIHSARIILGHHRLPTGYVIMQPLSGAVGGMWVGALYIAPASYGDFSTRYFVGVGAMYSAPTGGMVGWGQGAVWPTLT